MEEENIVVNPVQTIKRLLSYLKQFKLKLTIVIVLIILSTILSVFAPYILSKIIDEFLLIVEYSSFIKMVIILGIIYLISIICSRLCTTIMLSVGEQTLFNIRKDLFNHIEDLDIAYFDQNQKGDIMSRFTNDITVIGDSLTDSLIDIIASVITLIGVTIMMFYMNTILSITVIVTVPVFFFIVIKIGIKTGTYFKKQQDNLGKLTGYSEEMISSMKTVKSFNNEIKIINEFDKHNKKLRDNEIKSEFYTSLIAPINMLITNIGNILIILVGSILVIDNKLTVGNILAFLTYASMFRNPVNQLATLFSSIQSSLAGAERVFEVLDLPKPNQKGNIKKIGPINNINFNDVSFSYSNNVEVLKNINFKINKGENIAIVGSTGSGKTTIINLLVRFYNTTKGSILINDININDIDIQELRNKIGIILQDTYLFKGTVLENIKYGSHNKTEKDVVKAAKESGADYFIHRLPEQYNTLVEEEGTNFSHGERQLISIARTILSDPDILILDEATSNIDVLTENEIYESLEKLIRNKTSIVIAHRLKTIKNADKIIVLEKGKIKEIGSHKELISKKGKYYSLYINQFK